MTESGESNFDAEVGRLASVDPAIVNDDYFVPQNASRTEFIREQRTDPSLASAFEMAKGETNGFAIRDEVLYKRKPSHIRGSNEWLLVLPTRYKASVLKASHDSVTSGFHMGFKRTMLKIYSVFFMPKKEIKSCVKSCHVCQQLQPKLKSERAELLIPVIESDLARYLSLIF